MIAVTRFIDNIVVKRLKLNNAKIKPTMKFKINVSIQMIEMKNTYLKYLAGASKTFVTTFL